MWSKLGTRVLSAVIGVIILVICIFSGSLVFSIVVSAASLIVLFELCKTFDINKKIPLAVITYGFAALVLSTLFTGDKFLRAEHYPFLATLFLMLLSVSAVLWHDKIKFRDVAAAFFSLFYGVVLLCHLSLLRAEQNGLILVFLPLLGAWMPDTFAYFSGKLFGKHKLIPKVSPNKTVEGSIGGILGCVIIFAVFGIIVSALGYKVNYTLLIILALLCGVFSQFGDLTASVIKREYDKKDFGNLIPGHGGMLDRIDSLIFVTPVIYYFLKVFEVIGL